MRYTTPTRYWMDEHAKDPNFPLPLSFIRAAVADGTVPSIQIGRRRVFDADTLWEHLTAAQSDAVPGIRKQ